MEIIRADVMGFCMGVRRAVEAAEKITLEYGGRGLPIFTLGPLIHNPAVMESFKSKGVTVLDANDLSPVERGSPVVIRAHGACPQTVDLLKKKGAVIIDATCPRVRQSQNRVAEWSGKGYSVIVAGDKNHGEVTGISGYFDDSAGGKFYVVQNLEDVKSLELDGKTMLLAQTTFSLEKFQEIKSFLIEKNPEIQIFDSICSATMQRQKALSKLKGVSDGLLVVGGKNSANTKRLLELAEKICPKTCLIENSDDIPKDFLTLNKIALTAGASTPDWVIDSVEQFLRSVQKNPI